MTTFGHAFVRNCLAASVLLSTSLLQPAVASASSDGCHAATLSGTSQMDPATGAFVGGGTLALDQANVDVNWVSVITGEEVAPDGTLTLHSSHHITSVRGTDIDFTTSDLIIAVPTSVAGRYVFTNHLTIVSGSGRIARGSLDVKGRVDLIAGSVVLDSSSGSLCASVD
jgi:hypothetical protein